jgi:hypothetical protein
METRKITVISNKGQYKKVMNSAATTLGELKADMTAVGIDYAGMSFLEGLTRTELIDDASQLPTNVNYRGTITNDLVFYLTATNKKIKSGYSNPMPSEMSRQEVYDVIRASQDLQNKVKDLYGRNFTQVSTDNLIHIIIETQTPCDCEDDCPICDGGEMNQTELLASFLLDNGCITLYQYNRVLGTDNPQFEEQSPYSNEELEDMFDFMD